MVFFIKLIFRNLFRQKLRNALTALGIMVAIIAFCLLRTVVDSWFAGVESASSSRLITRNMISLIFPLPISYKNRIRQVENVVGVTHATWFGGVYISEKNFFPQFAIDARTYFDLFPELVIRSEEKAAFIRDRKGALVGRKTAEKYGWKIGDMVPIRGTIFPGSWTFVIRGFYAGAENKTDETMFLFHWDYLNEHLKKSGDPRVNHVGLFFVEIAKPDQAAEVSGAVDQVFKNSLAETMTETEKAFQLGVVAMIGVIIVAIQIVSFVVIVIIMAVMANTMAMSARERTREYATLKALGFGPSYISALIFGESLMISVFAGIVSISAAYPIVTYLHSKLGTIFPVFFLGNKTVLMAFVAAVIVGLVAALFPTWRAVRQPVSDGLRSMG